MEVGEVSLQILAGDQQSGQPGEMLAEPLKVRVQDGSGAPVAGQIVNFVVTSGNGHVFAGASLTNEDGIATERWTLGTDVSVEQRVEARSVDTRSGAPITHDVFTARFGPSNSVLESDTLVAMAVSPTRVDLVWKDFSEVETEYRVQRIIDGELTPIGTLGADSTTFSDTEVQPGTTYRYRVRACTEESCEDSPLVAVETADGTTGESGGMLSATAVSETRIDLDWAGFGGGHTEYRVQRMINGELRSLATLPADSTRYADLNLSAGTTYQYRVRACNAEGCENTPLVDATTLGEDATADEETTLPEAPLPSSGIAAAFPGAQGHGATAVGGRGGRVLIVNTLQDGPSGEACTLQRCTLRSAISPSPARPRPAAASRCAPRARRSSSCAETCTTS
jgi:hypothetical protein